MRRRMQLTLNDVFIILFYIVCSDKHCNKSIVLPCGLHALTDCYIIYADWNKKKLFYYLVVCE